MCIRDRHILQSERAEYGKQIVINLAKKLEQQFGKSFAERNLRRMMQFAENFPTFEIVSPLVSQLSWTHFIVLNSVKNPEARQFYAQKTIESTWSKRELSRQIERKAYERNEIASLQIQEEIDEIKHTFKDPYFLDSVSYTHLTLPTSDLV